MPCHDALWGKRRLYHNAAQTVALHPEWKPSRFYMVLHRNEDAAILWRLGHDFYWGNGIAVCSVKIHDLQIYQSSWLWGLSDIPKTGCDQFESKTARKLFRNGCYALYWWTFDGCLCGCGTPGYPYDLWIAGLGKVGSACSRNLPLWKGCSIWLWLFWNGCIGSADKAARSTQIYRDEHWWPETGGLYPECGR